MSGEKPRKATKETLAYLKSFLEATKQGNSAGSGAVNVVRELRYEVASVAADKLGSEMVQLLARLVPQLWVERLFAWCLPYARFLARHRHSSHVLETLLALLAKRSEKEGDGEAEDDLQDDVDEDEEMAKWPEDLCICSRQSRAAILLWRALTAESQAKEVLEHWNASHVARAALWPLAGLPVVSERRSRRGEGHAHGIDDIEQMRDDVALRSASAEGADAAGLTILRGVVSQLTADAEALQRLSVTQSGAPSLAMLCRVLDVAGEKSSVEEIASTLLELDVPTRAVDIIFGLSSDACGSVVMETLLRTCSEATARIIISVMPLADLVEGRTSNYVVQAALRRAWQRTEDLKGLIGRLFEVKAILRPDRVGVLSAALEAAIGRGISVDIAILDGIDWAAGLLDSTKDQVREHGARAAKAALTIHRECLFVPLRANTRAVYCVIRDTHLPWNRALLDELLRDRAGSDLVAKAVTKCDVHALVASKSGASALIRIFCATESDVLKTGIAAGLADKVDHLENCAPAVVRALELDRFGSSKWLARVKARDVRRTKNSGKLIRQIAPQSRSPISLSCEDRSAGRMAHSDRPADIPASVVNSESAIKPASSEKTLRKTPSLKYRKRSVFLKRPRLASAGGYDANLVSKMLAARSMIKSPSCKRIKSR